MIRNSHFSAWLLSLRSSLVVAEKNARIYYAKPPVLIFGILFPLFLFLAFALGREIPAQVLVPGMVAMTLFFTSSSVGPLITPWERNARTYERLLTTPLSLPSLLLGDVLAGLVFGTTISSVPLFVGFIFFRTGVVHPLVLVVGMLLASLCFACLGVLLSSPATEAPSQVMMLSSLVRFPLIFISGIFIPLSELPVWGKVIAPVSPLTYAADLMKYSLYGGSFYPTPLNFAGLVIFSLSFFITAIKLHKRSLVKGLL
jgi:ABC-2 type transport system permease protein